MTTPNFTSLLTALRAFVLKSRPAYRDYLGTESVEEKTVLLTGTLSATGESVTAADGFTGFTNGQTYKATIGDETVEVTAQYGTGSFSECIVIGSSNVAPSDTIPGWMVCVYNGNLLGFGTGEWAGKSVEVFTERTVKVDRWDVKKLPEECLPDGAATKKDPVFTGTFSQNRQSGTVIGSLSHAEGSNTTAAGSVSHAEGTSTKANGNASHAEGYETTASGKNGSHAEGQFTIASGQDSHAEGWNTTASGRDSHAEGWNTTASGENGSHAEGDKTTASGKNGSHAEGYKTTASGENGSHAEGYETTASGKNGSHAEGQFTIASGQDSHAEGWNTTASGRDSHAEGWNTTASGQDSHAEGWNTTASGQDSHAEGHNTIAASPNQHVEGKYNIADNTVGGSLHIVGNGTSDKARSNAHTLDESGNAWYAGDVYIGSTSGTNKDAGSKKLATQEYVDNRSFTFTITPVDGQVSPNLSATRAEMLAALDAGKTLLGYWTETRTVLETTDTIKHEFRLESVSGTGASRGLAFVNYEQFYKSTLYVNGNNTVSFVDKERLPNPMTKTEAMTQNVGMDDNGRLWTEPGASGGGVTTLHINVTAVDADTQQATFTADKTPSEMQQAAVTGPIWCVITFAAGIFGDNPFTCGLPPAWQIVLPAFGYAVPALHNEDGTNTFVYAVRGGTDSTWLINLEAFRS